MIVIKPISSDDVAIFKSIRLRALQEDASAFGSTFARESAFSADEWLARAKRSELGEISRTFIAIDDDQPIGIAGGYFEPDDLSRAWLVAMWVAPTYRRDGIGKRLVECVLDWARSRNARAVLLECVDTNHSALKFYQQLGFTLTGNTQPYPNDPALIEREMIRSLV